MVEVTFKESIHGFVVASIGTFLLSLGVIKIVSVDVEALYYVMSSIYQGLFTILALAGLVVIFSAELIDRWIDSWNRDVRDRLKSLLDLRGINQEDYCYLLEAFEYRQGTAFLDRLKLKKEEIERKQGNEVVKYCCLADIRNCEIKDGNIERFRDFRTNVWNLFKDPLIYGFFVITLSIFLLWLKPSSVSIDILKYIIGNWDGVIIVWLSLLSTLVIYKIFIVIKYAVYEFAPGR